VRQKLLEDVAKSLAYKIKQRGKIDPQIFSSACSTFVQVVNQIYDDEPPWMKDSKDIKRVMGLVQTHLGIN